MSRKCVYFGDKKINKSNFYKNKIIFMIDDIDANKTLVSKKSHMVKKAHLNTLLDTVIMMALYHYL